MSKLTLLPLSLDVLHIPHSAMLSFSHIHVSLPLLFMITLLVTQIMFSYSVAHLLGFPHIAIPLYFLRVAEVLYIAHTLLFPHAVEVGNIESRSKVYEDKEPTPDYIL